MSEPLFRDQALRAQCRAGMGSIRVARPLGLWWMTALVLTSVAAIACFLCLGSYTRRASVTGRLVPVQGEVTVNAPESGVVSWINVSEGGQVDAGGKLALVSMARATVDAGDTQRADEMHLQRRQDGLEDARLARHRQLQAQRQGLSSQLSTARDELLQVEAEMDTRHTQIRIATETLQRLRRLEQGQYVSLLQIKQQEASVLEYTGQWQSLQRQATGMQRTIWQLQQRMDELPALDLASDAEHARERARLEQERLQRDAAAALVIKAPVGGKVATRWVKTGQPVRVGQPLLTLLPGDGRLEAELWVPSRAVGFIAPGDTVLLRYQAFPYQKFGHQRGRVEQVSLSTLPDVLAGDQEASYRVTVSLARQYVNAYGRAELLKPGMVLDADIMGERRRLIEWMFEPLFALERRLRDAG